MAKVIGTVSLMQEVLSQTSHEELLSFCAKYLRMDVKAQLQFLARFSDKIKLEEAQKYEWLFYKSLQLLRGSSAHLGISKQKTLLNIYKDLFGQAADALAVNHYVKTFYILSNGLMFLRLLKQKERSMHKGFQGTFDQYMELLYQLYEADLPRDLIKRIIPFVELEIKLNADMLTESYFSYRRLKLRLEYFHNGIESLINYANEEWSAKALKSSDNLTKFYFILFTEPWVDQTLTELSRLNIPRDVWKKVLSRLKREDQTDIISMVWSAFDLSELFKDKRYKTFVKSVKPKRRKRKAVSQKAAE